jgi:hypothetical protein
MRVAVGVGSRGIANLLPIVRATVDALRAVGTQPFIVAAMGSHGGATAEGQRELLASYGITPANLGVPVDTDMTAEVIGTTPTGPPVWWSRSALQADAVLPIARVKPHTDFTGDYESGVVKMLVIGLGKRDGAAQHHQWGLRGLRDLLPESARVIVARTPFLAGLAVVENAREETAIVQVLDRATLFAAEPTLLAQARQLMGRLPVEQLDVLVIGELGKNYSGAGIDPNVVGRLLIETAGNFAGPQITRIAVLDVSPESHGNATGIGIADLTTDRALANVDPVPMRMNTLTACFLWRSKLPFGFPTDRACVATALQTCWQPQLDELRLAVIPNTLELEYLWVTPAVVPSVAGRAEVRGPAQEWPFDTADRLDQVRLFPHSTQARRLPTAPGGVG